MNLFKFYNKIGNLTVGQIKETKIVCQNEDGEWVEAICKLDTKTHQVKVYPINAKNKL